MDINTLTNYLSELQTLRAHYATKDRRKAKDLQTKIMDALRELNLYDVTSIQAGNLKFEPLTSYLPDPYYDSLSSLTTHLESKIEVYKHRIELAETKAKKANEQNLNVSKTQYDTLSKAVVDAAKLVQHKDEEIQSLNKRILEQNILISEKDAKINKKMLVWKITSGTIWSIIIGACLAFSAWTYELGKDNATKADDTEKAALRKSHNDLRDSVNMLKLKVDSLKKINKKG
ncbi:hypothetical protein [Sphingobacterium thalpophilum]|uniref:hypothetical protein n=1 Tax=Sphingobacterium thalpophilum TaxID=259 RepID=UPI003D98D27A